MEKSTDKTLLPENGGLQTAKELINPIPALLAAFVHRNKNQHRRSRWWAELGVLRRNLSRLLSEINAIFQAGDEVARERERRDLRRRLKGKKEGQKKLEETEARLKDAEKKEREARDMVDKRASWMMNLLVWKVWVAFSQLAADNQYAPMGLMLLGVLARVYSALDGLCPTPPSGGKDLSARLKAVVGPRDVVSISTDAADLAGQLGTWNTDMDLGVVVPRGDDVGVAASRAKVEQLLISNVASKDYSRRPRELSGAETLAIDSIAGGRKEMDWQSVSPLDPPAPTPDLLSQDEKKRKREKVGNDDKLDSIFTPLDEPPTNATRKKMKKPKPDSSDGDLDNIFMLLSTKETKKPTKNRAKKAGTSSADSGTCFSPSFDQEEKLGGKRVTPTGEPNIGKRLSAPARRNRPVVGDYQGDETTESGPESHFSNLDQEKKRTKPSLGKKSKGKTSKKQGRADLDDIFSSLM